MSVKKHALHGFLWDKKRLALIVIASTFMVRGNPYPVLFHSRTAKGTDRRGRRYASLAMTPLLPTSDHPTKIREEPLFSLFTDFCGIRKRPLVCHCERLYGARQSVLLLVHLCTAGVTDRRVASLLAMTPLFTDI